MENLFKFMDPFIPFFMLAHGMQHMLLVYFLLFSGEEVWRSGFRVIESFRFGT